MGLVAAFGIIAGARLADADATVAAVLLVAGLLVIIALVNGYSRILGAVLLVGSVVGGTAAFLTQEPDTPAYVGSERVRTTVVVASDPQQNSRGLHARVEWRDTEGVQRRSTMLAGAWPRYQRGDAVRVVARVDDADASILFVSSHTVVRRAGGLEGRRARLRGWLDNTVRGTVGGSEGALALGLLVGDDSALTRREEHQVRQAGLSHITAVSGWNVTLVVASVGTLLLALGLRGPGWVVAEAAALAGYIWLVGADAPVVRAAIMGACVIAARQLGRPAHGPTLIALAAALMIATDRAALGSLSFQLSILATAALIVSLRYTTRWTGWRSALLTPLIATAAISLATAPALAVRTGEVSLVSVPANVLAGPLVPLAAAGSVLVATTSWIPIIQDAVAAVTWYLTHVILWVAGLFAGIPGGVLTFPSSGEIILRVAVLALLAVAAILLPEGRFVAWQVDRWVGRDERAAAIVTGGMAAGIVAIVALVAP